MGKLGYGILAGAAATTALNAVTYLDMAVRGRPASRTPAESVRRLTGRIGVHITDNQVNGLGALLGYGAGVAAGAGYGLLTRGRLGGPAGTAVLTGMALLVGNGPMFLLGVTDPRRWSLDDWLSDVVPHLAFGLVGATAYRLLDR